MKPHVYKKGEPMAPQMIYLPLEQYKQVKAKAAREKKFISHVIREIVGKYLDGRKSQTRE